MEHSEVKNKKLEGLSFSQRLCLFLEEYVDFDPRSYIGEGELSQTQEVYAIKILLDNDLFDAEELKMEALKDYEIIIPDDLIDVARRLK